MLKPFAAALIVSVSALVGTESRAAEFNFTAYVYGMSMSPVDLTPRLDLAIGDTISGTFSYDQNIPVNFRAETEIGSNTSYFLQEGQASSSIGQISFNFGPTPTTLQFTTAIGFDNFDIQGTDTREDGIRLYANSSPSFSEQITGNDLGFTSAIVDIDLRTPETFFNDSTLPTTLNLDDFLTSRNLTFTGFDQAAGSGEGFRATFTSITDITTVDTPFSVLFLASGCMMLWMRRRPGTAQSQSV